MWKDESLAHSIQAHFFGGGCANDIAITELVGSSEGSLADCTIEDIMLVVQNCQMAECQGTKKDVTKKFGLRTWRHTAVNEDVRFWLMILRCCVVVSRSPIPRSSSVVRCCGMDRTLSQVSLHSMEAVDRTRRDGFQPQQRNGFLAGQVRDERVVLSILFVGSSHFLFKQHIAHACKTLRHATQSVVEGRCPVWLGPDLARITSKVGAVVAHDCATASVPSLTEAASFCSTANCQICEGGRRLGCRTHKNSEIGEGTRGGRCVAVGVGQGEESREGSTTVSSDCSDAGFHQTLGETIDGSGGRTQSRSRVVAGRKRESAPDGGRQSRTRSRRQCPICASADVGLRDGSVESQIVFCRRRAGCGSPGPRMQAASHHAQHNVRRHSLDASKRGEGSRRLDARSQLGSSRGPFCWQWRACVRVDLEVVRGGCTNVDVDGRSHADLILPNARQVSLYGYRGVRVGGGFSPRASEVVTSKVHRRPDCQECCCTRGCVNESTVHVVLRGVQRPTHSPSKPWSVERGTRRRGRQCWRGARGARVMCSEFASQKS